MGLIIFNKEVNSALLNIFTAINSLKIKSMIERMIEKIIWKAKEIKMCLQCSTDAKLIIEDVIPGYSLYQAKKNAEGWPEEWYGLVKENDPTFVFPAFGLDPDLCDSLTEEQINALPEDSKELKSVEKFDKYVHTYKHLFETDPNSGWDFVESCMRDGYSPDIDGFVECWFLNKVAQSILGGRGQ